MEVYNRIPPYYRNKFTQEFVKRVIKLTFEVMQECLLNGEIVRVHQFGSFIPKAYQSRKSWSHTQQKMIDSRPWMKIYFSMGRGMREAGKILLERNPR